MLFIYLYHGVLYADLWKSDLYIRPVGLSSSLFVTLAKSTFLDHIVLFVFGLSCPILRFHCHAINTTQKNTSETVQ